MFSFFKKQSFFYVLSIFWNVFLLGVLFSSFTISELEFFFHSDLLSFATLYKDIFHDGYSFFDWSIGGSTYIFPDRILYMSLISIFENVKITALVFAGIQYFSILFIFRLIIKALAPEKATLLSAYTNMFFSLFIVSAIIQLDFYFSIFLFLCNYHIGAFVLQLLALLYTIYYLNGKTKKHLAILSSIVLVATFSDRVFLIFYSIPIVVTYILHIIFSKNTREYRLVLMCTIASSALGIILHKCLLWFKIIRINTNYEIFSYAKCVESFRIIANQMIQNIGDFDLNGMIILVSFLLLFAIIYFVIKFLVSKQLFKIESNLNHMLLVYFMVFFVVTFIIQPLNGNYFALWLIRYIMAIFYVSLLILPIVVFRYFHTNSSSKILNILTIIILGYSVFVVNTQLQAKPLTKGLHEYISYSPKLVSQIDSLAKKYNVKYGVCTLLDAKVFTSFSKQDIRVYAVFDNLVPWIHGGNKMWYIPNKGKYSQPIFEYAVYNKDFDFSKFEKILGQKLSVDTIQNYVFVRYSPWVYSAGNKMPTLLK